MNKLQIHLFILISFIVVPLSNFSQHSPLEIRFTERNQFQNDSERLKDLFNAFLKNQAHIRVIRYDVRRVDTLISGSIRSNTGIVTLQPDKNDLAVGLAFYGKRDDSSTEDFYIDNTLFEVELDHKFYYKKPNYGKFVEGTPVGQMVLADLLKIDTTRIKFSLINIDDNTFVFKTNSGRQGFDDHRSKHDKISNVIGGSC